LTMLSKRIAVLSLIVGVIVMFAVWVLVKRQKPSQPIVDHPRLAPGVAMRDVTFFSQALDRDMQYRVLMPEGVSNQKLPIVYLLHGGGGGFRDWSNYSDVAQFVSRGLLLVMPQGDYSYYTNAALRPQDRYEDYIVNDLAADVARRFLVRDDRDGHAVAGVSMGGYGAVKLALQHSEKFAFAGALSSAIDAPRRRFTWRHLDQSRRFREMFGPDDSDTRHSNDPFFMAPIADPAKAPFFYLTCGQREGLLASNREFAALLDRYHIAHDFRVVPGGHDWNQWTAQLPDLFDSLASHLRLGTTSPLRPQPVKR
jgi:putative tributyrin esterase